MLSENSLEGRFSEVLELETEGIDRLMSLPQVAMLMFICLARGKFLTCCLNIFL